MKRRQWVSNWAVLFDACGPNRSDNTLKAEWYARSPQSSWHPLLYDQSIFDIAHGIRSLTREKRARVIIAALSRNLNCSVKQCLFGVLGRSSRESGEEQRARPVDTMTRKSRRKVIFDPRRQIHWSVSSCLLVRCGEHGIVAISSLCFCLIKAPSKFWRQVQGISCSQQQNKLTEWHTLSSIYGRRSLIVGRSS